MWFVTVIYMCHRAGGWALSVVAGQEGGKTLITQRVVITQCFVTNLSDLVDGATPINSKTLYIKVSYNTI